MNQSPERFAELLTQAVKQINLNTGKTIRLIQDELGYALGRKGGSAIEHWRKKNVPRKLADVEKLAKELFAREGLTIKMVEDFLVSAGHPNPQDFSETLRGVPTIASQSQSTEKRERHPFIVGPPIHDPKQFFGREKILQSIFSLWVKDPLHSVVILGPRRSGRTSLLYRLESLLQNLSTYVRSASQDQFRTVYIDFRNPLMRIQETLLAYILNELALPPLSSPTNPISEFMRLMTTALKTPTVLLLDDIEAGLAAPELNADFWWSWRALCNRGIDGKLAFVVTAEQSPIELAHDHGKPSPFFNIFSRTEYLSPFTEVEARRLIGSSPLPFSAEDARWMLEQSHCWPAPLQCLCQLRLEALQANDPTDQWREQGVRQLKQFQHLLHGPNGNGCGDG